MLIPKGKHFRFFYVFFRYRLIGIRIFYFSLCSISVQFSGLKHELTKFTAPLPITLTLDLAIPLYSRYLLVAVALFLPKTTLNFFAKYSSVPKQSVYPKIEIVLLLFFLNKLLKSLVQLWNFLLIYDF